MNAFCNQDRIQTFFVMDDACGCYDSYYYSLPVSWVDSCCAPVDCCGESNQGLQGSKDPGSKRADQSCRE